MDMFDKKKILITGGTGSLGQALTKKILQSNVDSIRIYSRDEFKQTQMKSEFDDDRLRFLIGDIRDKSRLQRGMENIDIVIHAAALKHIGTAEYNPFEAVKTNIIGSQNLIDVCLDEKVETVLAVGTDKAVSPFNTYGATKLLMERLFVSANNYRGSHKTKFLSVRYGNVLGSRGSILPVFIDQIKDGKKITITDPEMTRFNITMEDALGLIMRALDTGKAGQVFIPKLKAYKVDTLKESLIELLNSNSETSIIGVRPGEKYHESLINEHELRITFETKQDYILFDEIVSQLKSDQKQDLQKANLQQEYSSDKVELLTKDELKQELLQHDLIKNNSNY
jgi:UDP-N-acetylglucosamine 4,6-dehydratase/UDP-glucose 4-epimerase